MSKSTPVTSTFDAVPVLAATLNAPAVVRVDG